MKKVHKLLFFLALSLTQFVSTSFGMESKKSKEFSAEQKALGEQLVEAAYKNDEKLVAELLQKGAPINYRGHWYESTALHWAAYNDNPTMVTQDANPNITNNSGDTPLHRVFAAYKGDIGYNLDNVKTIINLLVANKANVNATNNSKQTPYYRAIFYEINVLKLLEKHGAHTQNSPEFQCIPIQSYQDVQKRLAIGLDPLSERYSSRSKI